MARLEPRTAALTQVTIGEAGVDPAEAICVTRIRKSPHQWLIGQRIERAKQAMLQRQVPLASVASDCGFTDQSHFTNAFTKRVGASPAAWHRQSIGAPA